MNQEEAEIVTQDLFDLAKGIVLRLPERTVYIINERLMDEERNEVYLALRTLRGSVKILFNPGAQRANDEAPGL